MPETSIVNITDEIKKQIGITPEGKEMEQFSIGREDFLFTETFAQIPVELSLQLRAAITALNDELAARAVLIKKKSGEIDDLKVQLEGKRTRPEIIDIWIKNLRGGKPLTDAQRTYTLSRLFAEYFPGIEMGQHVRDDRQSIYRLEKYEWDPETAEFTIYGRRLIDGHYSSQLSKIEWIRPITAGF